MSKRAAEEGFLENQPWKKKKETTLAGEEPGERLKTFKANHTLDSDEEDEKPTKESILQEDDVEGAEDTERNFDEGIKFTPFNLKEEMTEGHFDADGNYYENKEDEIRDNWLENIDWQRIKELPKDQQQDPLDDEDEIGKNAKPETEVFQDIIQYMKPGETITKAIQRLGGGKKQKGNQRKRWQGKEKVDEKGAGDQEEVKKNKEDLVKLTELADDILCRGNYEVYQYTYEKIKHTLQREEDKQKQKDEDAFDMFAEEVDESKLKTNTSESADKSSKKNVWDPDKVMWEFRWDDDEKAKIYGPYTSEQMQEWKDQDYFKAGVFVRKVGSTDFYTSKRIDFDLYI